MLVMLDLSAAFDSVDQEQLMFLFECEYRIQDLALSWLRSYLDGRTYRVQIDGTSCECGVYSATGFCSWTHSIHDVFCAIVSYTSEARHFLMAYKSMCL